MAEDYKNQFHPDRIEESKQNAVVREKVIREKTKSMIALGKKCLANPDFVKYKEQYEKLESIMVDSWLECTEPDPLKYTVMVRGMAMKLHQARLLLRGVEADATKKVEQK